MDITIEISDLEYEMLKIVLNIVSDKILEWGFSPDKEQIFFSLTQKINGE